MLEQKRQDHLIQAQLGLVASHMSDEGLSQQQSGYLVDD